MVGGGGRVVREGGASIKTTILCKCDKQQRGVREGLSGSTEGSIHTVGVEAKGVGLL